MTRLPWRLDLIGGGTGRERDEILKPAAALEDRGQVCGPQSREQRARLMGRAHRMVTTAFPGAVGSIPACGNNM